MVEIWTKELCHQEALKYNTRGEFRKLSGSAYGRSIKKKWLNDICKHMIKIKNPKGFWTKDKCLEEALKYNTRSEFNKNSVSAYCKAYDCNWLDDICSHMLLTGNKYKRCIYAYEFKDNFVYIGLTFDINKRNCEHMRIGPVFNHINITSLYPNLVILNDYVNIELSVKKEHDYILLYKKNGWNLLNKAKSGALGGGKEKWTKKKCLEEALKYNNVKDYRKNSLSYRASVRNKWLDEICLHMNRSKKSKNYWTKERCIKESLKFNIKSDFQKNSPGAYYASIKNNFNVFNHMIKINRKPNGYWTKERCIEEGIKYKSRSDFQKNNISAYNISIKKKWMDDIFPNPYQILYHQLL